MTAAAVAVAVAGVVGVAGSAGAGAQQDAGAPATQQGAETEQRDLDDAVRADEDVRAARERLQQAREEAQGLTRQLDRAVARYEDARAHHLRLQNEAAEVAAEVEAATAAARRARTAFEEVVVASYKRPGAALEAGGAVLASSGTREALHRAALVDRIVAGEEDHARRLAARAEQAADTRRQHRTIKAGVASARQDAQRAADALRRAATAAREHADQAAGQLETARSEARERIRAERAAQRRRERAAERATPPGQGGRGTVPSDAALADMACPIGRPHSFIDSWHYPRSGGRKHLGVDMFADRDTPIYAVATGTVRRVWHNDLGGLAIDLVGDGGGRWYYAHLQAAHVSSGQRVQAGAHIADTGNSGNARSTPPHLHWQYHPGDGDAVNPFPLASALCR